MDIKYKLLESVSRFAESLDSRFGPGHRDLIDYVENLIRDRDLDLDSLEWIANSIREWIDCDYSEYIRVYIDESDLDIYLESDDSSLEHVIDCELDYIKSHYSRREILDYIKSSDSTLDIDSLESVIRNAIRSNLTHDLVYSQAA